MGRQKRVRANGWFVLAVIGIISGGSLLSACDSAPPGYDQNQTSSSEQSQQIDAPVSETVASDKVADKSDVQTETVNRPTSGNAPASSDMPITSKEQPVKIALVDKKTINESENTSVVAVVVIPKRYDEARWHPLHFKPAIIEATNEQCLACHKDILERQPLKTSPAGVKAADSLAWYQTLDTYKGAQSTFHARHLTSDYAKQVMDLKCNFCHQGNDPREEVPGSHKENANDTSHVMRKSVNPSKTCLLCHGKFPFENMVGLEGPWHEARKDLEDPEDPDMRNGCMTCHGETYRTVRHQVSYLKADNIEKIAKQGSSDSCYGCHGGRQWYRISYPYPRHKWPDMEDVIDEMPEWAKNRPTESDARYKKVTK